MMERNASLFVRNEESVRIEVRNTRDGIQLVIEGPGGAASRFDFPPGTSVDSFRSQFEEKLISEGFRLQVMAERRSPEPPPPAERDRRRQHK